MRQERRLKEFFQHMPDRKKKSRRIANREKRIDSDKTWRTREISSTCDNFFVSKMMRGDAAVDPREDGPTPEGDGEFFIRGRLPILPSDGGRHTSE